MKQFCYASLMCICLMSLHACIDPYDTIENLNSSEIIVDAEISDRNEIHKIVISRSEPVGSQLVNGVTGAIVKLISDDSEEIEFSDVGSGMYTFSGQLNVEKDYRIMVKLQDGRNINSEFQKFPAPFSADSISVISEYVRIQKPNGSLSLQDVVSFFIHATKSSLTLDYYLRFDVETVFLVNEVVCSPFIAPKSCYVYNYRSDFKINLLHVKPSLNPISIKQNVFDKVLDYEMGGAFSVKTEVISYQPDNYTYWQQFKSLYDQSGSISDLIPAKINGNLSISGGNVLGLFSLVRKTDVSRVIRRGESGIRSVEPYCGTPGFFEPWPRPSECCNCLLFPKSTIQKPEYW